MGNIRQYITDQVSRVTTNRSFHVLQLGYRTFIPSTPEPLIW
jgi:hypothetical protein